MLQKLENTYLAILRFVVILVAGILLVAVGIFSLNSFKAIQSEPVAKETTPMVSEQELIKGVTAKLSAATNDSHEVNQDKKMADSNMVFYERASIAIVTFVTKHSNGADSADKFQVIEIIKRRAEQQDNPKLVSAYAKNFAESIEKTLTDQSIINVARSTSTLEVVNKALNIFTQAFESQIKKSNTERAAIHQEYLERKADGMQSLYAAAIAFGTFLLIVFLSIIIKIERNMRPLENKS